MLGFVIGTVCLIGLVKVLRRSCAWHGGYYGRSYGGPPFGHHGHHGIGRRWALRWLFERLETMPGQERAILQALDRLRDNRPAIQDEVKQTRADVARVIEGGLVDDSSLEETFARHDRLLARLRVALVEALKATTETLDERQRKELASLIAGGGFFGAGPRWGNPYRTWL